MQRTGKRKGKIIGRCLIALLILCLLAVGGYAGHTFIKTKDIELKSESRIESDALIFDADMSYLLKSYIAGERGSVILLTANCFSECCMPE